MAGLTSSGAEGSSSDDGIGGDGGGKRENEGKITISSVNILFLCSNVGRIYRTRIYMYIFSILLILGILIDRSCNA